MKTPTTIIEATEQLKKTLDVFLANLKWDYPVEKTGEFVSDDDTDLHITINGWLIVTPFYSTEEVPCIGGNRIVKAIHYSIEKEVLVRSCHRDDPDEYDIVGVDTDVKGIYQVVNKIAHIILDEDLEHIGEQFEMEEMYHEEEEFAKLNG